LPGWTAHPIVWIHSGSQTTKSRYFQPCIP
jgi:hypothetical protein